MGDILAVRDEYRKIQWAAVIQECNKASGLTNKEYCIRHGLSEKSCYYWQKKLRTQIVASAPELVPLEVDAPVEEELHIRYRGAELKLLAGVDMDAVAALLRSIQSL
jgi:hypothetical protein